MAGKINSLLIPQVSKSDAKSKATKGQDKLEGKPGEFQELLNAQSGLNKSGSSIQVSKHAAKRIHERNIDLQGDQYLKLKNGIEKLKEKGGRESLVITDGGAFIVDVPNNKIITAIDKESLNENVFTKIDSTIIV
jgi:flagellar operon protein